MDIDARRLIETLDKINSFGALESGGVERVAWTEPEIAARRWLVEECRARGFEAAYDEAGNVWAFAGERPAVVVGSHLDTVPSGGRFDGALGIAAALEVLTAARELARPGAERLALVCFTDEEGVRFGLGMTGSRAVAGDLTVDEIDGAHAGDGTRLGEVLGTEGYDPARVPDAVRRRDDMAAFLEVHVEQGRRLERAGTAVGIVTGIVALGHWRVEVIGESNHAGTNLPEDRRDALVPVATGALEARRAMRDSDGVVATVGEAAVEGGAINIVPGRARCSLDVRSLDEDALRSTAGRILDTIRSSAADNGCEVDVEQTKALRAAPMDETVRAALRAASGALDLDVPEMPSMAGHDAMTLSAAGVPCGMVFVRSRAGISHSPLEFSSDEDCIAGARLLGAASLRLAEAPSR